MAEGVETQVGGLVFLHVFLRRFFAALDLIEAPNDTPPRFTTPEARERAAALLWYTATAQRTFEPVETILPAHLVGLPKLLSTRPTLDPTPTENAMIARLLDSALVGLVENTLSSVEALRRAVLMRPGRLMLDVAPHRLQLARHPIDSLLDDLGRLPARVQLPWMSEPLKLEYP